MTASRRAGAASGRAAAIGEHLRIAGLALAGVELHPAADSGAVRAAWRGLPEDVALVVLTPFAAEALGSEAGESTAPLTVVLPP
ncbi:hypothetical protein I3F58_08875 [Streptomyces sp. MUM 203J]|uniref:hypothetical protein n=1 Tax=Streptomyces sp. MUM 203J TaxID=2791990 RepID=UPI001F037E9B|nr:hypothetical protein [Streptomyces sp. MUM 203J]MCH0539678.1 hypothetical protein [Streptomyces sp. MUM 203J]